MGSELRSREALERANLSMQAIKDIVPAVNDMGVMLNGLGQVVFELGNRMAAIEIVLSKYLQEHCNLSFNEMLAAHIKEAKDRAEIEGISDGSADTQLDQTGECGSPEESTGIPGDSSGV